VCLKCVFNLIETKVKILFPEGKIFCDKNPEKRGVKMGRFSNLTIVVRGQMLTTKDAKKINPNNANKQKETIKKKRK
jgi:hypothetical protein